MTDRPFRVIDTGVRPGRAQIAFDQALIEAHKTGAIPDTIRFLTFPPTVLVGRHQAISQELNLPACRAAGVGTKYGVTRNTRSRAAWIISTWMR